jgi:lipoprotein-anchoring transpeptidase ErfK/SrfK
VEVDKGANQLRVYDNAGTLVAVFPATVGSTERPAPSGRWGIKSVTFNPTYVYDPKVLTFGPKRKGVLKIAPGPNSPVGSVWIELTKATYGIHGAPDPELVGKTASHGCVRLTNWDAVALGHALKPATPVIFVGQTTKR